MFRNGRINFWLAYKPRTGLQTVNPREALDFNSCRLEHWQKSGSDGRRGFSAVTDLKTLQLSWNQAKNPKDRCFSEPKAHRYVFDWNALIILRGLGFAPGFFRDLQKNQINNDNTEMRLAKYV